MKISPKSLKICALFFWMIFSSVSFGYAQERVIKLKDGTVLRGAVLSKENDVYKIISSALGVISVKDADIVSIEAGASPAQPSNDQAAQSGTGREALSAPNAEVETYKQKILNDPNLMKSVQSLAENKEVTEILADPQLRSAIMRQDVEYLKNNEKFKKLADSPEIQKIANEAGASVKNKDQ